MPDNDVKTLMDLVSQMSERMRAVEVRLESVIDIVAKVSDNSISTRFMLSVMAAIVKTSFLTIGLIIAWQLNVSDFYTKGLFYALLGSLGVDALSVYKVFKGASVNKE